MIPPNNVCVFSKTFSGAYAGLAAADRNPSSPDPTNAYYVGSAAVAGAFANAVDSVWGLAPASSLDLDNFEELSEAMWAQMANPSDSVNLTTFSLPAVHMALAAVVVAMSIAADNYFAGQGIVPPAPGSGEHVVTVPGFSTFVSPVTGTMLDYAYGVGRPEKPNPAGPQQQPPLVGCGPHATPGRRAFCKLETYYGRPDTWTGYVAFTSVGWVAALPKVPPAVRSNQGYVGAPL